MPSLKIPDHVLTPMHTWITDKDYLLVFSLIQWFLLRRGFVQHRGPPWVEGDISRDVRLNKLVVWPVGHIGTFTRLQILTLQVFVVTSDTLEDRTELLALFLFLHVA